MLTLKSVSRTVGQRQIVDRVSFAMRAGERVAILGPSGSGKTSLLRLIAGFDAPSAGEVTLDGAAVSSAGRVVVPPERRSLGVTFQDATLLPHLDAIGNAALGIRGGDKPSRAARARQALQAMGLVELEGREVSTLSGGEAQRVALARALAADARLLLLDEPFGNVDRLTRVDLVRRLKARLDDGLAAIVITHDPADAVDLQARVLLMCDGRLVADGSVEAIAGGSHGEWAQRFLPPAN